MTEVVHSPKAISYDAKDALMNHQTIMHRQYTTNVDRLLAEYFDVTRQHAASLTAKRVHQQFVAQVDAMRGLLTTQKMQKGTGYVIVRNEWGKEHYKGLKAEWNGELKDLTTQATEAAVAWIIGNRSHPGYTEFVFVSDVTCYVEELGIVMQMWEDLVDAKDFVNSLFAVINAPLSQIYTPFAFCTEILGSAVVCMSLCPVEAPWEQWWNTYLVRWNFEMICAGLRLMRTTFPKPQHGTGGESAIEEALTDFSNYSQLTCAIGADGRWYFLDFRGAVSARSSVVAPSRVGLKWPRRELFFSMSGVTATPYNPHEFIVRFKIKLIADHLIGIAGGENMELISTLMHSHGVPFAPYIAQLFHNVSEQERLFQASLRSSNRKNAAYAPNVVEKLRKFTTCKSMIFSELFARAVKNLIREEWRRVCRAPAFLAVLNKAISQEGEDEDVTELLRALNYPLIEAANGVLQSTLTPSENADNMEVRGVLGHGKDKAVSYEVSEAMFSEILFIVNDIFVVRVLGEKGTTFVAGIEDIDVSRMLFVLSQVLSVTLQTRPTLGIDPSTNFFEAFFDLESTGCALRTDPLAIVIELPVCFIPGVKQKLMDFVSLQQRIAAKIVSTVDVTQPTAVVGYCVALAKYILLYANDVSVGFRGSLQDQDFEDVGHVHAQVPFTHSPDTHKSAVAFEALIAKKRCWLLGSVDLQQALRHLMRFTDKTKNLFTEQHGTAFVLSDKIRLLCKVCERFVASGLVGALETAISDLNVLVSSAAAGRRAGKVSHSELKMIHCAHLYLNPLSLLVKHVLQPDSSRTQTESFGLAVKYSTKRRDIISEVYGEKSIEAGVACNEIAAICSNNKYDFERAEEEFEKAVMILSEAQPEGPSIFVTMNNLAFLYYRKAERIRNNPQLKKENPQHIGVLLGKAVKLLESVMEAEGKVSVLHFAAALNNLASIKMFQGALADSRQLFQRTLEVTEHLRSSSEDELPCRAHAIKNLKILAKKQYLNAVMKVQANVRCFVVKMKHRRALVYLRAIKPIQAFGRGYLKRLFLAKHYRFSAFHSWLLKPRIYIRKLDSSYHSLPVEARKIVWFEKMEVTARDLQRWMRGFRSRNAAGYILNFVKAHFEDRRVVLEREVNRRRAQMFSAEAQRWKLFYAQQQFLALLDHMVLGAKYEAYAAKQQTERMMNQNRDRLFFEQEESKRYAVWREEKRVRCEIGSARERGCKEVDENDERRIMVSKQLFQKQQLVFAHLQAVQETVFTETVLSRKALSKIEYLEERMRKNIEVEFYAVMKGEKVMSMIPRCGRGFLWRKWMWKYKRVFIDEELNRRTLETEEADEMYFPALEKDWVFLTFLDVEIQARKHITNEAIDFFNVAAEKNEVAQQFLEFNTRLAIIAEEKKQWMENVIRMNEIGLFLSNYNRTRQEEEFSECVSFRTTILEAQESFFYHQLQRSFRAETMMAMQRSTKFALQVLEMREERRREELNVCEVALFVESIIEPTGRQRVLIDEKNSRIALQVQTKRSWEHTLQRHLFFNTEVSGRDHLSTEWIQWWKEFYGSFFADGFVELSKAATREHFDVEREQLTEWSTFSFGISLETFYFGYLENVAEYWEERNRGYLKLDEEEQRRKLLLHSESNLADMRVSFHDQVLHPVFGQRRWLVLEEEKEALLLEAEAAFALSFACQAVDEEGTRLNLFHVELREKIQRQYILEADCFKNIASISDVQHAEIACFLEVEEYNEFLELSLSWTLSLEERLRNQFCLEAQTLRLTIVLAREENIARIRIKILASTCFVEVFMLRRHLKVFQERFEAMKNTLVGKHKLFLHEMSFQSRKEASSSLRRWFQGYAFRHRLGRLMHLQNAAVLLLQRIGRALYARQRLAVAFPENVEHCFLFASEVTGRRRIYEEEEDELCFIRKFQAFIGMPFLRSLKTLKSGESSAAPIPKRPQSGRGGSRLFSTPAWQSPRLFAARQSNPTPKLVRRISDPQKPVVVERAISSQSPSSPVTAPATSPYRRAYSNRTIVNK